MMLRRLYCLGRIEQREAEWMAKKYRIKKRLDCLLETGPHGQDAPKAGLSPERVAPLPRAAVLCEL